MIRLIDLGADVYLTVLIIRKAYKFRLKPSLQQIELMHSYAGHCRFLWNKVLRLNLFRLEHKQPLIWYHEADYWSKLWKASDRYGFLKEVPAHCLQQKLKDAFDKNQPLKRLPTFRKREKHSSFRFPEPKQITLENRRIKLPKLGWIGFHKSQSIKGCIKNATVSRKGKHWFVSIQVEQDLDVHQHTQKTAIGIDVGIKKFAAFSDDTYIEGVHAFKQYQAFLAKLQRQLSKKVKFSNNWKKQKGKITKLHIKIACIRRDFLHKASTKISKSHAMIAVEDLKITNMSKSSKGTLDNPGTHVKAKSGLNRPILDQGWGEFRRQLEYKTSWLGGIFVTVPPKNTSIGCRICDHVAKLNRPTQERFECKGCGHVENADIHSAKKILAAGHVVVACGEGALAPS